MRNKILIGIAIALIVLVILVRYIFNKKYDVFMTSVAQVEATQLERFDKLKLEKASSLLNGDRKVYDLFTSQFDKNLSKIQKDTVFSFLYLSRKVKYRIPAFQYIECLYNKCLIDQQNEVNQSLIKLKEISLAKDFGNTFTLWYPKLKDKKLMSSRNSLGDCSCFFPEYQEVSFDTNVWNGFERFMKSYNNDIVNSKIIYILHQIQFDSSVAATRKRLRSNVIAYFNQKLSEKKHLILKTETVERQYNSSTLGLITYNYEKASFDKNEFQNVANDAFEEQWKSNSLRTGAMPYSSCYGSSNYCVNDCSKIVIKTGGSDVLVTIKDNNRDIVRHAYINGGNTFTFNVTDGQYQVFFYSGSGWNPDKYMTTASCGTIRGGFVSGESFTKDDYFSLNSQIMTYELIVQENGNLKEKPSSMDEAFK